MNPKDIAGKKFEKGGMFGYKPEEVDEYLKDMAYEFAQLSKEKAELERKLEILAEKVREYRNDEDAIKEALLGAQRQGKEIVADAKRSAERILAEANVKAEEIIGGTKFQIEKERSMLGRMQREVSDFKAKLLSLYKSHLDLITALPEVEDKRPAPLQEPAAPQKKADSDLTFAEAQEEAPAAPSGQAADAPADGEAPAADREGAKQPLFAGFGTEETPERKPSSGKFGELKFGSRSK